ncbi:phosphatidylglycerophosphatase and protein-tyrosine phosphatase 1 family protein [Rhodopirellula halodulae]|uniref:phosphatidylglycerophosphatase and protein-tyrosine phosphatase 1 family protein n=1 Tax=Rhodopirellula halodulae TaxID=2894198 RepID=UPI001E38C0CC|nr:phosphatidylglycerophosphatase and protein-tyrosine phosphatase 1 family protein [Rhodopirellula sp. JC737]MCC9654888.1 dual specificity protein phosphatase family protein [Rhodopirellula sp. JC737]
MSGPIQSGFWRRTYARVVFLPTLWWNMLLGRWLKVRNWFDWIDPLVIVGARPFARDVAKMAELNVGGVVNTCEEYCGPVEQYAKHEIEQLHLPITDFTHPSLQDVITGVDFIQRITQSGKAVYIHCKAGRARSATIAICWLIAHRDMSPAEAQAWLLEKRPHINPRLTTRPVVQEFVRHLAEQQPAEAR